MDSLPAHSARLWTVGAGGSQARYARAPIRNLTTGPSLFFNFWGVGGRASAPKMGEVGALKKASLDH